MKEKFSLPIGGERCRRHVFARGGDTLADGHGLLVVHSFATVTRGGGAVREFVDEGAPPAGTRRPKPQRDRRAIRSGRKLSGPDTEPSCLVDCRVELIFPLKRRSKKRNVRARSGPRPGALRGADRLGPRAALVQMAAVRQVDRTRDFALEQEARGRSRFGSGNRADDNSARL